MPMILLVVVGAINQSKSVPMMSLAVLETLTNQILWVYAGLHGSTQRSTLVYTGLCQSLRGSTGRSMQGSVWVYAGVYAGLCGGLHGGLCGSTPIATIDLVGDNREFNLKFKAYFEVLYLL